MSGTNGAGDWVTCVLRGSRNGEFGTCWYRNGECAKLIGAVIVASVHKVLRNK